MHKKSRIARALQDGMRRGELHKQTMAARGGARAVFQPAVPFSHAEMVSRMLGYEGRGRGRPRAVDRFCYLRIFLYFTVVEQMRADCATEATAAFYNKSGRYVRKLLEPLRKTDVWSDIEGKADAANAEDPTLERDGNQEVPAALLYGRRMSAELDRICPDASELLRIAARGQHVERWKMPRTCYPEGRDGYLAWRRAQAAFHAERVGGMMADAGYAPDERERVGRMLRKEGLKRDPEVQLLEDVICLVFLRWYFPEFARGREADQVFRIIAKTARKMSADGRARVAAEFDLPPSLASALDV